MPLDPRVAEIMRTAGRPRYTDYRMVAPADAARAMRAGTWQRPPPSEGLSVEDRALDLIDRELPVRIYRPRGEGPFPVLINMHGGGWVLGRPDMDDRRCSRIALEAQAVVISLDYRLAPEHPYPAALLDGFDTVRWVQSQGAALNMDASRIALSGSSSGGNLAAGLCLLLRDLQVARPACLILNYPVCDGIGKSASYAEFKDGPSVTADLMDWFWAQYAPPTTDRGLGYVSPLHARSLAGLPPTLITTAECDVLRDEAEAFAHRLETDGVPVILRRYDGMPHGFLTMAVELPQNVEATDLAIGLLVKTTNPQASGDAGPSVAGEA